MRDASAAAQQAQGACTHLIDRRRAGADPLHHDLIKACRAQDVHGVLAALRAGANTECFSLVGNPRRCCSHILITPPRAQHGYRPLHHALLSRERGWDVVRALVAAGADVNAQTDVCAGQRGRAPHPPSDTRSPAWLDAAARCLRVGV